MLTIFGLPPEVRFCKKCVLSNQRPTSVPELTHTPNQNKKTLFIDEKGICDACRYSEFKETGIDWTKREEDLLELLERHRRPSSHDGCYDVLVPGSGGKDSVRISHVLKYKYGMHPLTVTWPPHVYTDIGWRNFRKWIDVGGFDNISYSPNGRVHRLLTRLAVENLFHPFQPFIVGQKNLAPKIALKFGIKLIFYGENEAEYGNPIQDNFLSNRSASYFSLHQQKHSNVFLGGISVERLLKDYGLTPHDLEPYLPPDLSEIQKGGIDVRYLGYYVKWVPQENYYYAVEKIGFEANPERTEGTFSKYVSLDDKIDGFHYWTKYIKFGLGRASADASQEIRNHHLTRQEAVQLVHRFDGEFPKKYFNEVLEYIDMTEDKFFEWADRFRTPHLWERVQGEWRLIHRVS